MTAAYNMSVHEVNLAVIKQTLNKQLCDEVLCGYEREPILRITALSKTALHSEHHGFVCLILCFLPQLEIRKNMIKNESVITTTLCWCVNSMTV